MSPTVRSGKYIFAVIAVVVVLAVLAVLWQRPRNTDPAAVFWNALQHNLTEKGLTCTVADTSNSLTSSQSVSLDLAGKTTARAVTKVNQQATSITTEEIDTKTDAYIRYTALSTSQRSPSGAKLDFHEALNVWSKNALPAGKPSLFGRTALGNCVVPLAGLTPAQAQPILAVLHQGKVFKSDLGAASQQKLGGHTVDVYSVAIQPGPYTSLMKQVGKAYGLQDLDSVDVAAYAAKTAEQATFSINPRTQRIEKIVYAGRQRTVAFTNYGIVPQVTVPKTTVSVQELEKLLQTH